MSDFAEILSLGWDGALVLFGTATVFVQMTNLVFGVKWAALRAHGLPYYSFTLMIGIAIAAMVIEAGSLIVFILTHINFEWAAKLIVAALVAAAAVHIYLDRRNHKAFRVKKLIAQFALPLSPLGAVYADWLLAGGNWFILPIKGLIGAL